MNVVIDIGNTVAKVGIFEHHTLVEKKSFPNTYTLMEFVDGLQADHILFSSVNKEDKLPLAKNQNKAIVLGPTLPLPIQNRYATPLTLGMDRLAGACGAWHLFPKQACLVIDLGTCITYDVIDGQGNYYGGGIGPGLTMRFQAVHTFTARLPLVKPVDKIQLWGDSTEKSIQAGITHGMAAEIEGMISRFSSEFEGLQVILCGGDTGFFENKVKAPIFAVPELVLIGLNTILLHNVDH